MDGVQGADILVGVDARLGLAVDVFAQEVQRGGHAGRVGGADRVDCVLQPLAGHEAPRRPPADRETDDDALQLRAFGQGNEKVTKG